MFIYDKLLVKSYSSLKLKKGVICKQGYGFSLSYLYLFFNILSLLLFPRRTLSMSLIVITLVLFQLLVGIQVSSFKQICHICIYTHIHMHIHLYLNLDHLYLYVFEFVYRSVICMYIFFIVLRCFPFIASLNMIFSIIKGC